MVATTWNPAFMGANGVLSGGNLIANMTGNQEWVRATNGRTPAAGGPTRRWQITVPTGSGVDSTAPGWGMVSALKTPYSDGTPGYNDPNAWSFGFGITDYSFHNSMVSVNWTGGGHGGAACVIDLAWDPIALTLKLYLNGALTYTANGVSSGPAVAMYPHFESGASGAPGTFTEQGTGNFGATPFTYDIPGTIAWDADYTPSSSMFAMF